MVRYHQNLPKALADLFPEIGFDESQVVRKYTLHHSRHHIILFYLFLFIRLFINLFAQPCGEN